MSTRLAILKDSLAKKESKFGAMLGNHIADVKKANGQPLNDKRCGYSTLRRWGKQEIALRTQSEEIEKTRRAIEREEFKIQRVENADIPDWIRPLIEDGTITQWRKHPHIFFVKDVKGGRIQWDKHKQRMNVWYRNKVPADQIEQFDFVVKLIEQLQFQAA